MYATGIPSGMMVDSKTPRWGVALGIAFFAAGYYPIAQGQRLNPEVQQDCSHPFQPTMPDQEHTAWLRYASFPSLQVQAVAPPSLLPSKLVGLLSSISYWSDKVQLLSTTLSLEELQQHSHLLPLA
jgi:hypothetical protein